MVMEVARARVMAFSMGKEGHMWDALKKLIGADEESKKRRQELDEQERLEREERARSGVRNWMNRSVSNARNVPGSMPRSSSMMPMKSKEARTVDCGAGPPATPLTGKAVPQYKGRGKEPERAGRR